MTLAQVTRMVPKVHLVVLNNIHLQLLVKGNVVRSGLAIGFLPESLRLISIRQFRLHLELLKALHIQKTCAIHIHLVALEHAVEGLLL